MLVAMKKNNDEDAEWRALRSVQDLLRQWARWDRRWKPKHGYPSAVPYLDNIRPTVDSYSEGEDYDEEIDAAAMKSIDQALEHDLTRHQAIAIRMTYLNEVGPAVWRSNRVPRAQVRRLCEEAELALIPALRRRHVRL